MKCGFKYMRLSFSKLSVIILVIFMLIIILFAQQNSEEIWREGEFLIDTNVVYVPARADQWPGYLAFDGTNYLIVWRDGRNGVWDIYCARMDTSGIVLDSTGISVFDYQGDQYEGSVAFDGTNYFVVWYCGYDIYGARISVDGVVLDTTAVIISNAINSQCQPCAGFNGTNYLVVWRDSRNGNDDIYGARVSTSGIVLDTQGIAISTDPNSQEYPYVCSDGINYLVAWHDGRNGNYDVYGARVSQSGVVLDTSGIPIKTGIYNQGYTSIAFDGINYLVVWEDAYSSKVCGARVDTTGVVLDPNGFIISGTPSYAWFPSVSFDGTNYLVVWVKYNYLNNDVYGARVSPSGVVLDPSGFAISTAPNSQNGPFVGFGNINYLVVWADNRGVTTDVYGTRVSPSANVLDPGGILISTAVNDHRNPGVTFDGTDYFVVWEDYRGDSSWDIYGIRVDSSGSIIDSNSITISNAGDNQNDPCVIFGEVYNFVVWEDWRDWRDINTNYSDIYSSRVSHLGVVLDPAGIPISNSVNYESEPSVAFDGNKYLAVWQDSRNSGSGYDIYGARIDTSGVVLDTSGIAISIATGSQYYPSVAFDNTNYLVVWEDRRNGSTPDVYGARVDTSGLVLDTSGIAISTATGSQYYPSVAFDGTNYLVVWQDSRNSGSGYDIYGARVDTSGIILDPEGIAISTAQGQQRYPVANFDGTNYLVVWQDSRSNYTWDIYGAKVSTSGEVLDTYVVSTQTGNQLAPALARGNANEILVTYSGWTDSINTHAANTMRIWGMFYSSFGVEEREGQKHLTACGLWIYPNPCRQITDIRYHIPEEVKCRQKVAASIKIYDVSGRLVRHFNCSTIRLSDHVVWDGFDDSGRKLAAGVYFVKFEVKDFKAVKKVVFLK